MLNTITTYRDFESREHLTEFVEEQVRAALARFIEAHDTRVEVTLNHDRATAEKLFHVGITLRPAHRAPIHVERESESWHSAVRDAVRTAENILRRDHSKRISRKRQTRRWGLTA